MTLEPWGEIDGRVMWGDTPGAGESIDIGARTRVGSQFHWILSMYESVETDAQGRFRVGKVPPGLAQVSRVNRPPGTQGASLRPLLQDPANANWTKPAITQVWHNKRAWGYSIRTERWRYTEWLEGKAGRELYDQTSGRYRQCRPRGPIGARLGPAGRCHEARHARR